METAHEAQAPVDAASVALAIALQLLGLPASPAEILHQSGKVRMDEADLLRVARRFPVKARLIESTLERLKTTPLPAIARLKDGGWLVIGRVGRRQAAGAEPVRALARGHDRSRPSPSAGTDA